MIAEKIKNLNLSYLVEAEGVRLRRSGRYWIGKCPFHEDKVPSFTVKGNRFRCYGCGASGDVIDFIRGLKGASFPEALSYLGVKTDRPTTPVERKKAKVRDRERKQRRALVETFRAWESNYSTQLGKRIRGSYAWIRANIKTPNDLEGKKRDTLSGLYKELPFWEWALEILACGDDEEKFELFKVVKNHERP